MSSKHTPLEFLFDLLIPVGAVLVICFALGSLFYDGHVRFSGNRSHEVLKAYRESAEARVPY